MKPVLFPKPKEVSFGGNGKSVPADACWKICSTPTELHESGEVARTMLRKLIPCIRFSEQATDFELQLQTGMKHSQPEAYTLLVKAGMVTVKGATRAGVICGLATLRQLMMEDGGFSGQLPNCEIIDWPDVRWRAASRWLIDLEGKRMAYDWGEGRIELLRRYREKIDFAMNYKINLAFFEGFCWQLNKYPEYNADIRSLNQYAAARNVALEFGGHYIGIGGRNPEFNTAAGCGFQSGLGDLNRHIYPNGEPYRCMGKSEDHPTRFNGTCRSNEQLNELKMKQLAEYVRQLEPGVLYLHPEDVSSIQELGKDWSFRCPECRRRWPSDVPEAKNGAAGAQAWNLTKLYQAVCSVRNTESGYNGAKDCLCVMVPAAYAGGEMDDESFERTVTLYRNIAEMMPKSGNLLLLMREQFKKSASGNFRIAEMARNCPLGIAVFAVNGADGYVNGNLFFPGAMLNGFYQGAEMIFNFAGTLYQEVQEVFNSENCWTLPDLPPIAGKRMEELISPDGNLDHLPELFPDYHSRKTAFLETFCRSFYGSEAGKIMAEILQYGTWDEYPMFSLMFHFEKEHLFDASFLDITLKTDRKPLGERWRKVAELTDKVYRSTVQVKNLPQDQFIRENLVHFNDMLGFSQRVTGIIRDLLNEEYDQDEIQQHIAEARQYLTGHFHFNFTSSEEGAHSTWYAYLDRLEVQLNKKKCGYVEGVQRVFNNEKTPKDTNF